MFPPLAPCPKSTLLIPAPESGYILNGLTALPPVTLCMARYAVFTSFPRRDIPAAPAIEIVKSKEALAMKPFFVTSLLMLSSLTFALNGPQRGKGLSQIEVTALLATGSTSDRIAKRVQDRGLNFTPNDAFLKSLQEDGADDSLLTVLKSAQVRPDEPSAADPTSSAKDSEALAHLHRAAQLNRNNFHPREAEPEFRLAAAADPANPFVHVALGEILARIGTDDEAIVEFRAALNLQPDLADAH